MRKKEKGITLIALVITIIVLLILAGVALSMVAGNEGILTKAEKAVNETNIAGAKEQVELMIAEISADYYEKKFVDKTESGKLVDYIKNALATEKPTSNGEFSVSIDGSGNISVTDKGGNPVVEGTLDENGKIIWDESAGGNGGAVVEPPLEVPENPVASYDVSEAGDGSIMAYIVAREGEIDIYDMLIIGEGAMIDYGPYDEPEYQGYDIVSVEISSGVTHIGEKSFKYCSLRSIEIPSSVEIIGEGAFLDCENLSSVNMAEGVTTIEKSAFRRCISLSSIEMPDSIAIIGDSAFEGCTNLSNISMSDNVIKIEKSVFYDTAWYNAQPDGVVYIGKVLYGYKGTMPDNTTITIKEGTKCRAPEAFYDCTGLSNINIPDCVETIGKYAFYNTSWYNAQQDGVVYAGNVLYGYKGTMPSNTVLTINEGVKSITDSVFFDCENLVNINIPDTVISIGYQAFNGCINLTSINIPDSVRHIGWEAFDYWTETQTINFEILEDNIPSTWDRDWNHFDMHATINWGVSM